MSETGRMKRAMRWLVKSDTAKATCVRLLITTLVCLLILLGLDPATRGVALAWRNLLPVLLIAFLFFAVFGRWLFSLWLIAVLTAAFYAISHVKMHNMNMPLLPGDVVLKDQVLDNLGFFADYLIHGYKAIVLLLIVIAVTWSIWRLERHAARPSWITRLVWLVVPVVCLYTMFCGYGFWASVYGDRALAGFQLWDPAKSIKRSGLVAGFFRMGQASKIHIPKPDASVVRQFAHKHEKALEQRENRPLPPTLPDIVVVQSEAFFDPGIMKQISLGEFDPNFHRLADEGIHGALKAPTYGGGTIRTEFETLTGYPMRAFPSVLYPYYGLAAGWMPSVPTRLASMGYSTTLFHPFLSAFWNRREVMPRLGFQKMYFEKAFAGAKRAGLYVSDAALFKFVLAHLKSNSDKPQYVMAITMENHGPWDRDPGKLVTLLKNRVLPTGLSAQGKREMQYYLSHLVNGDEALATFADRLMARKRWTVLVFYGDHLPALNAAFKDVGFDDDRGYSPQTTRYMILSNRPLQPRDVDIPSYELPGLLFDTIGLPLDGYLAMDATARQSRVASGSRNPTTYRKVLDNAARMEATCQSRLTLAGTCGKYEKDHTVKNARMMAATASAQPAMALPASGASCSGKSCNNVDLTIEPKGIPVCDGKARPSVVTVKWSTKDAKSGAVRLWVQPPGAKSPTLWAEKGRDGQAPTGPWVVPGMQIIMTDAGSGKRLSILVVPSAKCETE